MTWDEEQEIYLLHGDSEKRIGVEERYNVFGGKSQLWIRMYKFDEWHERWKGYGNIIKLNKDDLRDIRHILKMWGV